jgi:hypothetical protein
VALSYLAGLIADGSGDFNLVPPYFKFFVHSLDANGEDDLTFQMPDDPTLAGLSVHFQWLGPSPDAVAWGKTPVISVPEKLSVFP